MLVTQTAKPGETAYNVRNVNLLVLLTVQQNYGKQKHSLEYELVQGKMEYTNESYFYKTSHNYSQVRKNQARLRSWNVEEPVHSYV